MWLSLATGTCEDPTGSPFALIGAGGDRWKVAALELLLGAQ